MYSLVPLGEVLSQDETYIKVPEPKTYPKLSVKLYGKGVVLDAFVDGSVLKMKRHQIARSGQVILSEIWGKKGAIGFVPPQGDGALCTSHFFLFDVLEDKLDPRYLQAIFTANFLVDQLGAEAKGTTGYAAVRPKHLLAARIPLPPLSEQQRIVARIEELAARIEEARGLRRQAMEEARVLAERAAATLLGSDWPVAALDDLLREPSRNGLAPRPSDTPPGTPILRISAATSRDDAIVDETDVRYLQVSEGDEVKYKLEPGDLLACRFNGNLNYVGRFALYSGTSSEARVYPDKLIRFRLDTEKALPEFVRTAMNGLKGRAAIESLAATTAGNIGISASGLKTVRIPVPPISEQRRIVAYLDDLQTKVDSLKQLQAETAVELDALLPSVLDRAFKGEL